MSKRLINTMIIILTAILLLGAFAIIVMKKLESGNTEKASSIEEVLKVSVDVPELMTNLKSNEYVKISFKVQTDGKKAKEEFQMRDFQIKNLIISELSEMEADDLQGKKGKKQLEETMKVKINDLMQDGKIVRVYITSYIIS
ncbi:flagellar basal body-associated protein FliL [Lederbergia citrea]|uniref:Flagellar protein FliL n=1 Tax=Lederbergia citrea TaxID=2833581 RepID=A0A942Z1M2_9BACI|nr:flagellar basal body-associated protein FliL [Lederbergia citrea]MBS4177114.1 flagellar basal body-associated protein FliL [Lederbergia citrea]MBS4203777.1 flagellar basal body-associated protein FliL [Lederbergia citrea]MBS4221638.1 flagellar basal body-associated protein FliL [Lederbergia citrea]